METVIFGAQNTTTRALLRYLLFRWDFLLSFNWIFATDCRRIWTRGAIVANNQGEGWWFWGWEMVRCEPGGELESTG
jgi:hypothetical protein